MPSKTAEISRTVFIMDLKKDGKTACHFFTEKEEDDDVNMAFKDAYMPRDRWEELGEPKQITVTIEPGDKLNG